MLGYVYSSVCRYPIANTQARATAHNITLSLALRAEVGRADTG